MSKVLNWNYSFSAATLGKLKLVCCKHFVLNKNWAITSRINCDLGESYHSYHLIDISSIDTVVHQMNLIVCHGLYEPWSK